MINYSKRIAQFQKSMKCAYTILVSEWHNSNVFYFTGFRGFGILIILKNKKPVFFATKLDIGNVANKKIKTIALEKKISEHLKAFIKKNRVLGFDFDTLSVGYFTLLKKILKPKNTINVSDMLLQQRAVKDAYEIQQLRKAGKASCDILNSCIKMMPRFRYEYDVKHYIESEIKRRGHDISFDTIIASANNGANPHYSACNGKLKRGFLMIDFGAKVNGYCADMTRTFFLGKPTKEEIEAYNKVLMVQTICIQLCKKNEPIDMIDTYARKHLGNAYVHSLGHGIGIDVHEEPRISFRNKNKLQNGNCFTIEPGVYYPGKFGIRIEDDLVKLGGKLSILTPFTKKLIIIKKGHYKSK